MVSKLQNYTAASANEFKVSTNLSCWLEEIAKAAICGVYSTLFFSVPRRFQLDDAIILKLQTMTTLLYDKIELVQYTMKESQKTQKNFLSISPYRYFRSCTQSPSTNACYQWILGCTAHHPYDWTPLCLGEAW